MRSDNTHHLLAAAQRRRDSTLERAQRACGSSARPVSATRSPTSPPALVSPAPGSTPKPGYATRSANSPTNARQGRESTKPSAAPTRPCGNGSNSPTPASLNSTTTTVACATK